MRGDRARRPRLVRACAWLDVRLVCLDSWAWGLLVHATTLEPQVSCPDECKLKDLAGSTTWILWRAADALLEVRVGLFNGVTNDGSAYRQTGSSADQLLL